MIQKCLHELQPMQTQFIFDAVTERCVEVATHRHGCCVMQRCIDFGDSSQRVGYRCVPSRRIDLCGNLQEQLVTEIIAKAMDLVQDAFGNYVVQYVLDLGITSYCDAVTSQFLGNLSDLAVQKFSSNVIERVSCLLTLAWLSHPSTVHCSV